MSTLEKVFRPFPILAGLISAVPVTFRKLKFLWCAKLWVLFSKYSAEKTKCIEVSQPPNKEMSEIDDANHKARWLKEAWILAHVKILIKCKCALWASAFWNFPSCKGPKPQNCPKWLGEGAQGVLVYVDQTLAALALVQETHGRPNLQLAKTSFAPYPNHFGQS